ncbi:MAG: phosphoenolpyruvate carboxykinase (ATP) [Cytophagales bacterium]
MKEIGIVPKSHSLAYLGINKTKSISWNLSPAELVEDALAQKEGVLSDGGALMVDTGEFTGRAPKDKFFVKDALTEKTIWWGEINQPIDNEVFESLLSKMAAFVADKKLYARDLFACAEPEYQLKIRVINSSASHNLFADNMFIRPESEELKDFEPEFTVLSIPEFQADTAVDKVRSKNFAIINLTKKIIIIGGTGYTGEIKKGIFTVLNYTLPLERNTLSMHCSANVGKDGDTAVFFGLSGTGKTTLSADPSRQLVGDDEHGWSDKGVFNFEGGCYAKVINLSPTQEPEIYNAIKFGAILENTRFFENTRTVDFDNVTVSQNTRVSYPIDFIPNALIPSVGGNPKNIFFLTADAFGVLPPISQLTPSQAMYHFISGYTSKVAGTEVGIVEPQMVFSACFGAPFFPLHPTQYASLLGDKMKKYSVNVWLINTGWTGGPYGVGTRMKLKYTRAMITAAMEQKLDGVEFALHPIFGISVPSSCPGVPHELLDPKSTWEDKNAYDEKAKFLAKAFNENFKKFEASANDEIKAGAPKI